MRIKKYLAKIGLKNDIRIGGYTIYKAFESDLVSVVSISKTLPAEITIDLTLSNIEITPPPQYDESLDVNSVKVRCKTNSTNFIGKRKSIGIGNDIKLPPDTTTNLIPEEKHVEVPVYVNEDSSNIIVEVIINNSEYTSYLKSEMDITKNK